MIQKVLLLLFFCLPILASAQRNAFFALDTGTRDARHTTAEQQVTLLNELGFDGIAPSLKANGQKGIADLLRALDKQGLKMFAVYMGVNLDAETPISEDVKAVIRQLQGRDTVIWLYVMAGGCRPSHPKRDDEAERVVKEVAGLAEKEGLRVSLYPHAGFWLERVEDGVRLAQKVNRKNVGVTFNLCHWMKADGKELEERLEMAKPYLSVVTVNGLDADAKDWPHLVQPLDSGTFDVSQALRKLKQMGYAGPIGLQHYNVRGPVETNLKRSMDGWRRLQERVNFKET